MEDPLVSFMCQLSALMALLVGRLVLILRGRDPREVRSFWSCIYVTVWAFIIPSAQLWQRTGWGGAAAFNVGFPPAPHQSRWPSGLRPERALPLPRGPVATWCRRPTARAGPQPATATL